MWAWRHELWRRLHPCSWRFVTKRFAAFSGGSLWDKARFVELVWDSVLQFCGAVSCSEFAKFVQWIPWRYKSFVCPDWKWTCSCQCIVVPCQCNYWQCSCTGTANELLHATNDCDELRTDILQVIQNSDISWRLWWRDLQTIADSEPVKQNHVFDSEQALHWQWRWQFSIGDSRWFWGVYWTQAPALPESSLHTWVWWGSN